MPPKPHISNFTESQNCWGQKESQEIFHSATSAQCRVKKSRFLGAVSSLVSNITKDGDSRTGLNQCLSHCHGKTPQLFLMFKCHFQFFNLCLLPLILSVRRVWLHLWRHKKSLSSQRIIQLHLCLLWQNIKVQCFVSVSYYFPESLSKACSCPERHFSDRHVCTIAFYCGLPRSAV